MPTPRSTFLPSGLSTLGAYFELYWVEPERTPLLIMVNERSAGFCLVREVRPGLRSIAEFYIEPAYRRQGAGRAAARLALLKFPGEWQVAQLQRNLPAIAFWRDVVAELTGGEYREEHSDAYPAGPLQRFNLPG